MSSTTARGLALDPWNGQKRLIGWYFAHSTYPCCMRHCVAVIGPEELTPPCGPAAKEDGQSWGSRPSWIRLPNTYFPPLVHHSLTIHAEFGMCRFFARSGVR